MTVLNEGTAAWVEELRQVDTTDPVLGGSGGPLNAQGIALGQRTRWLRERILDTLVVPVAGDAIYATGPYWEPSDIGFCMQNSVTSAHDLRIWLPQLGVGSLLAGIQVRLQGASGHTALPGTLPRWVLMVRFLDDSDSGVQVVDGTWYGDPSESVGAYQSVHAITGAVAVTVDPAARYLIQLEGEAGANAMVGLQVRSVTLIRG